jgi:Lrp/AsnC family transcriptional regulator for asnA, asnC and gidA
MPANRDPSRTIRLMLEAPSDARDPHREGVALLLRRAPLDELDRRLIDLLQDDGRRPISDLARTLQTNAKTVRRRVERLLERKIIQITAVTTPEALGYGAIALVGLEIDGTRPATAIAQELAELPAADYVVATTGRFPVYVELFCRDRAELARTVDDHVRTVAGVRSAEVFPYLSLHYQQAQFASARDKTSDAPGVRPLRLEPLDRAIIGELTHDGRRPFLQIARNLGISEAQVRQRVRQITDTGVAEIIAIANPLGLGYTTTAWIAITVSAGRPVRELAERLSALPAITYVAICAGRYDIFTEVMCTSDEELLRVLDADVRTLPGIESLEVAIYLDLHYKRLLPIDAT